MRTPVVLLGLFLTGLAPVPIALAQNPTATASDELLAVGQTLPRFDRLRPGTSRYLRYALFNAAKYVCIWDSSFSAYLAKKRVEGKHYNVAVSHAAKKLVRLIYALQKSGQAYRVAT